MLALLKEHGTKREPDDRLDANDAVRMMRKGRKVVLVVEDNEGVVVRETAFGVLVSRRGSGLNVFAVSLDGFREALGWVTGRCGWRVK